MSLIWTELQLLVLELFEMRAGHHTTICYFTTSIY